MNRLEVYALVDAEREAQERKWGTAHGWGVGSCASGEVAAIVKSAVLTEECGEVARAVLDRDDPHLAEELVQVAAVAVAWLESLGLTPVLDALDKRQVRQVQCDA